MSLGTVKQRLVKLKASAKDNRLNVVYMVLLFINYFSYAFSTKIITYSITDLSHIYGVPHWELDLLFIPIYIGFILGSFTNYLHAWGANRQLVLAGAVLLMAVANCLLPHYGYLSLAYAAKALNGLCSGAWECGNSIWLMEMAPKYFASALQLDQLVYNIGALGTIYLIKPFLWNDILVDPISNQTVSVIERRKALAVPFLLNGFLQSIVPCILITLYFVAPYTKQASTFSPHQLTPHPTSRASDPSIFTTAKRMSDPFAHGHSTRKYKMALSAVSCVFHYSAEIAYLYYCKLLFKSIGLSEGQSDTAYLLLYTSSIVGPLVLMVAFVAVRPENVVPIQVLLESGSLLALFFFGRNHIEVVYGANVILGLTISTVHPAILAFIEINLELDERDISTYTLMSGISMLMTPFAVKGLQMLPSIGDQCIFLYEAIAIPGSFALFIVSKWWIFGWNDPLFMCFLWFKRVTRVGETAAAAGGVRGSSIAED